MCICILDVCICVLLYVYVHMVVSIDAVHTYAQCVYTASVSIYVSVCPYLYSCIYAYTQYTCVNYTDSILCKYTRRYMYMYVYFVCTLYMCVACTYMSV